MEKLNHIFFYTLEKSIKTYRKYAQNQINLNGFDITIDQWLVLKILQENENIPQNQIAEMAFKDMASITRMLDILVKKKYVKRKGSKTDRRKFELEITQKGNDIINNLYPLVIENRKKALQGFKKDEIQNLKLQLEKLIHNCE